MRDEELRNRRQEGTEATKQRRAEIAGRNGRKRERGKKTTQGHTETRHREVAEHVGTVQYVVVVDKRVGMHTAAVLMLEEETVVAHSNRNSHGKCMRHEACIVENMLSHRLIKETGHRGRGIIESLMEELK